MSQLNRRKLTAFKSSPLPLDYLRMVNEVIANNFAAEFKELARSRGAEPQVSAAGAIYLDEVLLSVSLIFPKQLRAITAHASADFDPQASSPKIDELLGLCLDGAGSLLQQALAQPDLDDLSALPLEWAPVEIEKRRIFVRVDRSNPALDQAADAWLATNDPQARELEEEEESETAKLFKTGPVRGKNGPH